MNISIRLTFFREHRKWQPEDVARQLGVSAESYIDIEKGRVKINEILAEKLSGLYQAPKEFFLVDDTPHYMKAEVMYSNCTFINGAGGSSGYINHQYNDRGIDEIIFFKKEEIKSLKQQIEQLQQQNEKLLRLLTVKQNF